MSSARDKPTATGGPRPLEIHLLKVELVLNFQVRASFFRGILRHSLTVRIREILVDSAVLEDDF